MTSWAGKEFHLHIELLFPFSISILFSIYLYYHTEGVLCFYLGQRHTAFSSKRDGNGKENISGGYIQQQETLFFFFSFLLSSFSPFLFLVSSKNIIVSYQFSY
ncbi:hypothetical protein BDV12DRAFT_160668 [Aspergillus spectabilis]